MEEEIRVVLMLGGSFVQIWCYDVMKDVLCLDI